MWLSIGSIVSGYIVMALIVMIGTIAATAAMIPGGFGMMKNPVVPAPRQYLIANLAVSFVAALVGGWLTARMAPNAPMMHSAILGALLLVMSVVSARTQRTGQPSWYPMTLAAIGVVGVLIGGFLKASAG